MKLLLHLFLFGFAVSAWGADPALSPRVRFTINDGWRYADGPIPGAAAPGFDDRGWMKVHLPHTWNAEDGFDEATGYRRGEGWYRRPLAIDPRMAGRRIYLFFEGANQIAEVWVDGKRAGRHIGGYSAFVFDITPWVKAGATSVIAVRVDNSHDADVPPLNGDFTFWGGIYRDVWLVATDPVHVNTADHGSTGVFIDTPDVSDGRGTVRVRGSVRNDGSEPVEIRVMNRIIGPDGAEEAVGKSSHVVTAGENASFEQRVTVDGFRLWSPESPVVYRVITEVFIGDRLADAVENPLGFRWVALDEENRLRLNGRVIRLAGTNRHQDRPSLGSAISDEDHRRDVEIVKETGFNFLRLAHYPQDPAVLDATDHLGLLVWEEIPVVNLIGMSDAFAENAERMLIEMIRQHYNHPSIVFWGTMNEVLLTKPDPIPAGYYERVAEVARRLDARARSEDPRRLTVLALSRDEIPPLDHGIAAIPDILGLNLYFGWYYEKLETLGTFLDDFHRRFPDRPLIVSEYGAGSDERVHSAADPVAFDFSSEYAQIFHRASLPQILEREFVIGSAVWNQFDFGSELRHDTKHAVNQKGLYFFDRTPKDTAHYYQAMLRNEPVLRIAREWDVRSGSRPADRLQKVWAYTNLDEVIFFVNGKTLGPSPIENRMTSTAIMLDDGVNEIRAAGRRGDRWFTDTASIRFDDRSGRLGDPAAFGIVAAVNAGAPFSVVDSTGLVWEADRAWEPGGWGWIGGKPAKTHHRIFATPDDPLFQTSREALEMYRFDVADGTYEVELRWAEWQEAEPRRRIFTVSINGAPVWSDLDMIAAAGRYTALVRKVIVTVAGGQGLRVEFDAERGNAAVSAIAVRRIR